MCVFMACCTSQCLGDTLIDPWNVRVYTGCAGSKQALNNRYKSKGTAVPLQAWSGPEDYRNLKFPDFMTTAQEGGKVVSLTHRPHLPPGNSPGTHFC